MWHTKAESHCHRLFLFFFQAEDGIRDLTVTGVQTCALPIFLFGGHADGAAPGISGALAVSAARDGCVSRLAQLAPLAGAPDAGAYCGGSPPGEIGRASCRGRVEISVGAVSLKKKKKGECR